MNGKRLRFVAVMLVAGLLAGGIWWSKSMQSVDADIISRGGIHWHPVITIIVKGEKQTIPADIGVGPLFASQPTYDREMGMTYVHTHDDADQGIIHFEFPGIVRKDDLTLKNFLDIWGKNINSFGSDVMLTVNGVENPELENYSMKDGDQIMLIYK